MTIIRTLSILNVKEIGRQTRGGIRTTSGPIYRSWNGFGRGRWRAGPSREGTTRRRCAGRLPAGVGVKQVHLSRAEQSRQRDPEILLAAGTLNGRLAAAMTPNPMDSAGGRISRVNGCLAAGYDPLWNFTPLCVRGGCTGPPRAGRHSSESSGYLKLPCVRQVA